MALVPSNAGPANSVKNERVQTVRAPELVILKQLESALQVGQKTANILPTVTSAIKNIESELIRIESAAKNRNLTDPEISTELSKLKQKFQSCIEDGKFFLRGCVTMARYGTNSKIHEAITKELNQRKLNELGDFIINFKRKVGDCQHRLDTFTSTHAKVEACATSSMMKYKSKATQYAQEKRTARRRLSDAWLSLHGASGLQIFSGALGGVGVLLGRLGIISPRITGLTVGLAAVTVTGSWLYQHRPALHALKEKEAFVNCTEEHELFKNAQKKVSELQNALDKVKKEIDTQWKHASQAKKEIAGLKEEYVDPEVIPSTIAGFENINGRLDELKRSMNSILETLGPEGAAISSEPEEVVSNTVAEQPTDDQNTPDPRNPLDLPVFSGSQETEPSIQQSIPAPIQVAQSVGRAVQIAPSIRTIAVQGGGTNEEGSEKEGSETAESEEEMGEEELLKRKLKD